jgi:hypothetical protein
MGTIRTKWHQKLPFNKITPPSQRKGRTFCYLQSCCLGWVLGYYVSFLQPFWYFYCLLVWTVPFVDSSISTAREYGYSLFCQYHYLIVDARISCVVSLLRVHIIFIHEYRCSVVLTVLHPLLIVSQYLCVWGRDCWYLLPMLWTICKVSCVLCTKVALVWCNGELLQVRV